VRNTGNARKETIFRGEMGEDLDPGTDKSRCNSRYGESRGKKRKKGGLTVKGSAKKKYYY